MINSAVEEMIGGKAAIGGIFVCADHRNLGRHGFVDKAFEGRISGVLNDASHYIAITLDSARDDVFLPAAIARPMALGTMLVFGFSADERLIDLNNPDKLLEAFVGKASPDPVAHVMGGAVGAETHDTLNLERGDALLAGEHHVNDAEPFAKGLIGILEDGPGNVREAIARVRSAVVTLPLKIHCRDREHLYRVAAWAVDTIRPTVRDQVERARIFVRKHLFKLRDRHLMDAHGRSPVSMEPI